MNIKNNNIVTYEYLTEFDQLYLYTSNLNNKKTLQNKQ